MPTSTWRPGELIADRYLLTLPDDLPPGDGYHLEALLYSVPTLDPVGQARLGDFALPLKAPFEASPPPRVFALPPLQSHLGRLEIDFGDEIRLVGYDLEPRGEALRLTLWWQALRTPTDDYTVFVHLFDPASEDIVAQSDAPPRGGAYPTSWWMKGEVVSETVNLSLTGVPEGVYWLAAGLYDRTLTRLPAVAPDGYRIASDRPILTRGVRIKR